MRSLSFPHSLLPLDVSVIVAHSPRSCVFHRIRRDQKALKIAKRKDYYKVLDVNKSSSESEIKRAYYKAAKTWHPGTPL